MLLHLINLQVQVWLVYLDLVRTTFESTPEVYNNFLDIMKDLKLERFSDIQTTTSISFEIFSLSFEIVKVKI